MQQRPQERRLITLIFADLSGFTKLSHSLDPEDVQEIANTTFEVLNKPIIERGGMIHKYEGDLVIALFGLPVAHEDDPERAIKASLKMMELIPEVNDRLSKKLKMKIDLGLHIGINSGIVVAGEVGSEEKKEWTVMGDAVNLASRLKDIAKNGEIIVSESVFRASRYLFDYEAMPPVSLKGIEKPVRVYKPLKIKEKPESKRGIQGLYSPLVGRDKEFQMLKQKIDELYKGKGGVVFILGDAGLGKTRLYEELKKNLITHSASKSLLSPYLLEGRCSLYNETISYSTILQILKDIFSVNGDPQMSIQEKIINKTKELFLDDYEDVAPYICHLFSVDLADKFKEKIKYLEPESLKIQIFLSVKRLLFALTKKQPLILVIEDYHWIDPASLELLEFILEGKEDGLPLLFIALSRIEKEKEPWRVKERLGTKIRDNFSEIVLKPLDYESSTKLAYNLLNFPGIPEEFKNKILKKAEGNPFYLEEIIRSLIDTGYLIQDAGVWRLGADINTVEIPDTVQSVITSRIDRLELELKEILQIASVIGRSFYRRILQNVSEMDELLLTLYLTTLEEFEFIKESKAEPEIEYTFRHPLLQEVVYNNLLKKKRKELHNRVAECVEKFFAETIDEFCDLLSQQFYLAENWEKALEYSIRSAERAKHVYLNKQAIDLYDRAIICAEMIDDKTKKIYCIKEKSQILNLIGESRKSLDEINQAINLSREIMDKKLEADCLIQMSDAYANLSRYEDMLNTAKESLSLYKTINNKRGEAESLNNIGYAYEHFNDYEKALEYYNRSLKIQEEIGNRDGQAVGLNNIGVIYANFRDYTKALEYFVKSLRIREEQGHLAGQATSLNNIGTVYDDLGEPAKALEYYKKSLKIQEEINDMDGQGTSLNNLGYLFSLFDDYKNALQYYMKSLKIREEIGDRDGLGTSHCNIGVIYEYMGDYEKALHYYMESLKIRKEINDRDGLVMSLYNIGNICIELSYLKYDEIPVNAVGEYLSNNIKNEYDMKKVLLNKAKDYLERSEMIAEKNNLRKLLSGLYLNFAELKIAEHFLEPRGKEKAKLSEASKYIEKSLNLAGKLQLEKIKTRATLMQARIETLLGHLTTAEEKYKVVISMYEGQKKVFNLARAYYYYGEMLMVKGEIEKGENYLQKAKEIFEKIEAKGWLKKCNKLLRKNG